MNPISLYQNKIKHKLNSKCIYFERGCCRFGNRCRYRHDMQKTNIWNPLRLSTKELIIRSRGKTCGICFEEVINKKNGTDKFGILPNCKHCFCFTCIKMWRSSIHFEHEVTKGCPECRISSNYVYKNSYWVDDDYKDEFISDRKKRLASIDCKYYRGGKGVCRLGSKCLFRHVPSPGASGAPSSIREEDESGSDSAIIRLMLFGHSLTDDDHLFDQDDWDSDSLGDDDDEMETFYILSEIL
ncbi:hypothetical protein WA026_005384 [Henosepilachna vigintioctopunctata]|uniref:RING-type E3 ubiquitin transferase n=1 Tax=Henosepilachna vigintioctopunctata TaxID=420089 RepID=A0AAW1U0R9_9CUCU